MGIVLLDLKKRYQTKAVIMTRHRRDQISRFCRDFFQGNNQWLCVVVAESKHMFTQIDIQSLRFTQDTFAATFQRICKLLFMARPATSGYVIAMLGFAVRVHEYHRDCSWYTFDTLIDSMANVLEETDFNPKQLTKSPNFCILL